MKVASREGSRRKGGKAGRKIDRLFKKIVKRRKKETVKLVYKQKRKVGYDRKRNSSVLINVMYV